MKNKVSNTSSVSIKHPLIRRFIGDKRFYRRVLTISVPIMIQSLITNFVSLLDNIMVGQIGTEEMSGVAIVNQLIFVYYLFLFGGLSGVGIFTAQYYGKRDDEGIRQTFRFKLWMSGGITLIISAVLFFFGKNLIQLYLNDDTSVGNIEEALQHGLTYLSIVLIAMPAILLVQSYAGTMRDCGRTKLPMVAGIIAVAVNLVLDYLLIFGKLGLPALGVAGAAIATVIARYVEAGIVVIWAHTHTKVLTYMKGVYRTMRVPWKYTREFLIKGIPLLLNEGLWSIGMSTLLQCYSVRGMEVVAAFNIANVIGNSLNVIYIAMGDAVAIIVGQLLGAGKMEEAKDTDTKILTMSLGLGIFVAGLMAIASTFFPSLYNTTPLVKETASRIILINACFTPQMALLHTSYFTIRAGGRTVITSFFDSGFLMACSIPTAFLLSRLTALPALTIFVIVCLTETIKLVIGLTMVHKNIWMRQITV